ncbi:MAG: DegT/DnrJ/EryC1/StrS family aminotransferase [Bacteroidales bacterium]
MKEIRMVDLAGQYDRIRDDVNPAIQGVIDSTAFIRGEEVRLFEEELSSFLGVKHVISCGNGTDALQVALMVLGLKPGDEVITTDFTFIATAEVIALLGLKPVLVDPEPGTFNISVEAVKKAITPETKAIIPVHLFGQCADMEQLLSLARQNNIFIVEDAAQATGTTYRFSDGTTAMAGTIGDLGCTSFFPSKNLGCFGDGGAIYTQSDKYAALARSIVNHGMTKRYYHDHIGVNSRLDTIQAAILRVKLRHLADYNIARQDLAARYDSAFGSIKEITIPERSKFSTHIFHQYTIKTGKESRDNLKEYLAQSGIPSMVYYPVPLHRQEAYSFLGYGNNDFPVSDSLSYSVLSLPMHTEMEDEQAGYIIEKVTRFFKNK